MITINSFKQLLDDLANQYQTGAGYGSDAFNRNIPVAVLDMVRSRIGLPETYKPGEPVPAIAYELAQVITDELAELKISDAVLSVSSGVALKPLDYYYPSSMWHPYQDPVLAAKYDIGKKKPCGHIVAESCDCHNTTTQMSVDEIRMLNITNRYNYITTQRPVQILNDAMFNQYRSNSIRKPDLKNVICRFNNTQIEFLPISVSKVLFTYLRYPKIAKWNFTRDPNSLIDTFDPVGSQDIELPSQCTTPLLGIMLERAGIVSREVFMLQAGEKLNTTGK